MRKTCIMTTAFDYFIRKASLVARGLIASKIDSGKICSFIFIVSFLAQRRWNRNGIYKMIRIEVERTGLA